MKQILADHSYKILKWQKKGLNKEIKQKSWLKDVFFFTVDAIIETSRNKFPKDHSMDTPTLINTAVPKRLAGIATRELPYSKVDKSRKARSCWKMFRSPRPLASSSLSKISTGSAKKQQLGILSQIHHMCTYIYMFFNTCCIYMYICT